MITTLAVGTILACSSPWITLKDGKHEYGRVQIHNNKTTILEKVKTKIMGTSPYIYHIKLDIKLEEKYNLTGAYPTILKKIAELHKTSYKTLVNHDWLYVNCNKLKELNK